MAMSLAVLIRRDVPQCGWEKQRMLIDERRLARRFCGRRASLHDAELEGEKFMLLIVFFGPSSKMGGAAVQPVEMRWIDGVLHRLEPIAVDQRIDHDPASAVLPG